MQCHVTFFSFQFNKRFFILTEGGNNLMEKNNKSKANFDLIKKPLFYTFYLFLPFIEFILIFLVISAILKRNSFFGVKNRETLLSLFFIQVIHSCCDERWWQKKISILFLSTLPSMKIRVRFIFLKRKTSSCWKRMIEA